MQIVDIYKHTNIKNGKCYIGSSNKGIEKRWKEHVWQSVNNKTNMAFHFAIRKYGAENFIGEVVWKCLPNERDECEAFFIEVNNSYHNGYNSTFTGSTTFGWKHTDTGKQKISTKLKGRKCTDDTKAKLRAAQKILRETIDENGFSRMKNSRIKQVKTSKNTVEGNGRTIEENSQIKRIETIKERGVLLGNLNPMTRSFKVIKGNDSFDVGSSKELHDFLHEIGVKRTSARSILRILKKSRYANEDFIITEI